MSAVAVTNSEFLEAMFADLPDGACAMVCSFAGDPLTVRRGAWFAHPWAFGSRLGTGTVTNNYVAMASFLPDPMLGEYRRRKANFASLHAVMLDDLGPAQREAADAPRRTAARLRVIETSPSNFQAWLFLEPDVDTDTRTTAEQLIQRMIEQGLAADTDPGMSGVTRFGRLPVGINGKAKYLRTVGRSTCASTAGHPEFRYRVADVAQAFGLDLTPEPEPARVSVTLGTAHARIDDFAALLEVLTAAGYYQCAARRRSARDHCPWLDTTPTARTAARRSSSRVPRTVGRRLSLLARALWRRGIGDVYRFVRDLTRGAA